MIFNFQKFLRSLRAAFRGIKTASSEQTFRLFLILAFLTITLMILFEIPLCQSLILILAITICMGLELINSQMERLLDVFHPAQHPQIKIIKDMTAAAVLLACLGALAIGILIFLPYFLKLL